MKTALVTGAASGLGQSVIRALLADGDDWLVISVSKRQPPLSHERLHWHAMDLSDDRFRYALVNAIRKQPIDLLVHCSLPCLLGPVLQEVGEFVPLNAVLSGETFLARRGEHARIDEE